MTEQKITPWSVEGEVTDGKVAAINYDHVISQFGCQKLTKEHVEDFKKIMGQEPHRFLRRNLAFAHRDFEKIMDCIKNHENFFIYTGRGPSSLSMHLGHAIPFIFCKYLQDVFKVPFVVQITDDEKFLCKELTLRQAIDFGTENIKDIIAFGFDPDLTYIFSNYESSHLFLENTLKISKPISLNEAMKVFWFDLNTNIGIVEFPSKEIAVAFSSSFSFLKKKMQCLVPCAVDQDPLFRLARNQSNSLNERKPTSLYLSLLPSLLGTNKKMSASDPKTSIYLSYSAELIKSKVNKYAFSGGQETLELHREKGGNTDVDIPYQYLRYFFDDDEKLEIIKKEYESGKMTTGEMKKICVECIQEFVQEYQDRRSKVTDEDVKHFKDISKFKNESEKDLKL